MSKDTRKKSKLPKKVEPKHLEHINRWAAGIDIGSRSHFVALPEGCDETTVREFKTFTSDLYALADWLKQCGIMKSCDKEIEKKLAEFDSNSASTEASSSINYAKKRVSKMPLILI